MRRGHPFVWTISALFLVGSLALGYWGLATAFTLAMAWAIWGVRR
jgi:hypothetical protein